MDNGKPSKDDMKSKLKIISTIFYMVFVIWLLFLGFIVYKLIAGEESKTLFIATIPIVAVLIILSQIKSKIKKEIRE